MQFVPVPRQESIDPCRAFAVLLSTATHYHMYIPELNHIDLLWLLPLLARQAHIVGMSISLLPYCQEGEHFTLATISLATHLLLSPSLFMCLRATLPWHYLIVFHAKMHASESGRLPLQLLNIHIVCKDRLVRVSSFHLRSSPSPFFQRVFSITSPSPVLLEQLYLWLPEQPSQFKMF